MTNLERPRPIFTFYGDDFTGSTDALEALALNGVASVLFLEPPGQAALAKFAECKAIGIAGDSRSQSPEWMTCNLPQVFRRLKQIGGKVCQYKVCSTFDSSPEIGSIGRALEIGGDIFGSEFVPVFAAAPRLKRYVLFSNLFAAGGDNIYRIDRHPTMSCHPVTPMSESDLRVHLSRQTNRQIESFDLLALESPDASSRLDSLLQSNPDAVLFDGLSETSVRRGSGLIWERRSQAPFVVASSGFTYGLAEHWRSAGLLPGDKPTFKLAPADRVIVMSGSCSPITECQIRWSLANGFVGLLIQTSKLADTSTAANTRLELVEAAMKPLQNGRSLVLYTALGPNDCDDMTPRHELAAQMGRLLRELLLRSAVKRTVIAGGDTSSHAGQQLGIYALTVRGPLAPGAPLCEAHTTDPGLQGLEIVLKGGQVGAEDFFFSVLKGAPEYRQNSARVVLMPSE